MLMLPVAEREYLALAAWESLADDPGAVSSRPLDPEGIAEARQRDREIESGAAKTMSHAEFLRRTDGSRNEG